MAAADTAVVHSPRRHMYLADDASDGVTIITRPIKDYARSNPALYLSIIRAVAVRTNRTVEFVLKVGKDGVERKHEGQVYGALSDRPRAVPCVYWGCFQRPYALPFIAGTPCLSQTIARDIERHFDDVSVATDDDTLHAVITLFRPTIVSLEQCIQDKTLPPANYVTDAIRVVRRLFKEVGLVHYDLHHHNQLVDFVTGRFYIVDLDFATTNEHTDSRIFSLIPVDLCVTIIRQIVRATGRPRTRAAQRDEVGHFYDLVMLYVAHRNYVRRTQRSTTPAPPPYSPPTPDERRLFRCYQMAQATVRGISLWSDAFRAHLGDRFKSVKSHSRLLLVAMTFVALYTYGIDQPTVRRRLRRVLASMCRSDKNMRHVTKK